MIVSDSNRFVFIHNPKAAGTSIRKALGAHRGAGLDLWGYALYPSMGRVLDIAHMPLDILIQAHPELFMKIQGYFAFGFVRNPIQRYFSSVHQFILNFTTDINREVIFRNKALFEAYVNEFADFALNQERIDKDYRFAHFTQQSRYFFMYDVPCAKFFKVEQMDDLPSELTALGITSIGQENASGSALKVGGLFDETALTPEVRLKVREFYAKDFELLGYPG